MAPGRVCKRKIISPSQTPRGNGKRTKSADSQGKLININDLVDILTYKNDKPHTEKAPRRHGQVQGASGGLPASSPAPAHPSMAASTTSPCTPQSTPNQPRVPVPQSFNDFTAWFESALRSEGIRNLLRSMFDVPERQIQSNTDRVVELESEVVRLNREVEELKQYGRRNAVRIYNPSWKEMKDENTDELVVKMIQTDLKIPDFPKWLISRSHRVGRTRVDGNPRPVLVKFVSYRAREMVFKARKNLPKGVYINEDLTPGNSKLSYQMREMKRLGHITDTWTYDGRVYVKVLENDRGKAISSLEDAFETITLEDKHADDEYRSPMHVERNTPPLLLPAPGATQQYIIREPTGGAKSKTPSSARSCNAAPKDPRMSPDHVLSNDRNKPVTTPAPRRSRRSALTNPLFPIEDDTTPGTTYPQANPEKTTTEATTTSPLENTPSEKSQENLDLNNQSSPALTDQTDPSMANPKVDA